MVKERRPGNWTEQEEAGEMPAGWGWAVGYWSLLHREGRHFPEATRG